MQKKVLIITIYIFFEYNIWRDVRIEMLGNKMFVVAVISFSTVVFLHALWLLCDTLLLSVASDYIIGSSDDEYIEHTKVHPRKACLLASPSDYDVKGCYIPLKAFGD